MKSRDIEKHFDQLEPHLRRLSESLKTFLEDNLSDLKRIDQVTARSKSRDSFLEKCKTQEHGKPKYQEPFYEIQDLIGARIVTFYLEDVIEIEREVKKYLSPIEVKSIKPDSEAEFGYEGRHLILSLPTDVLSNGDEKLMFGRFFELQIKTLYQHAWGQAEHDLGYKDSTPLDSLQRRQLAFTSAQSWGADMIFNDLMKALKK